MIQFKEVELADKSWIMNILRKNTFRGCEFTFSNLFAWGEQYNAMAAEIEGMLVIRSGREPYWFTYPIGEGDAVSVIKKLMDYAAAEGIEFRIQGLTGDLPEYLDAQFPNTFTFSYNRNYSDYIYLTENLQNLTGKKYSAKRNHINNFERDNPDWKYVSLCEENMPQCRQLVEEWCRENGGCKDPGKQMEFTAVQLMLDNFEELELSGGAILVEGKMIAFTLGERVTDDTFVVHVEKTFADIQGAYPIINREFAKNAANGYKYLNREEDMGVDGLRKSKLSYYPEIILDKYEAVADKT